MATVEWTAEEWPARRKKRLDEHRAEWERSANPYYVWEALTHCSRDEPLPGWICDYLALCNSRLRDLAFPGRRDPKLSPGAAAKRIPEALGFRRRPNWNAIRERRHDNDISSVLLEVATGKNSGTLDHLVIGGLAQRLKKSARQIRNLRDEAIQRVRDRWR
jgi:hypothetical protein